MFRPFLRPGILFPLQRYDLRGFISMGFCRSFVNFLQSTNLHRRPRLKPAFSCFSLLNHKRTKDLLRSGTEHSIHLVDRSSLLVDRGILLALSLKTLLEALYERDGSVCHRYDSLHEQKRP